MKDELLKKIANKKALLGIIGMGYVGLPLALTFAEKGSSVIGFDIDEQKIPILNSGRSYIKHIESSRIKEQVTKGNFKSTSDFSLLSNCECIIICVPTPLNEHREPDVSFIENSGKTIAKFIKKGQLIILESSTYPGTTEEILLPLFAKSGFDVGTDFFLAFSPEREDPGNEKFSTGTIPKIVGGVTSNCLEVTCALYNQAITQTVPVSSPKVAEAAKLLENIYRSVNIALVNELKIVFDRMSIDVWEVIDAAKTKPFGFTPFYPGPGLGGHCIPIDPFYLTWKAREYEINTKFIELAGEINTFQPYYVVQRAIEILNENGRSIKNSKILLLGVSYKKNIDDMRESPSLKLIELLSLKGAIIEYSDPYISMLPHTRKYKYDLKSIPLESEIIRKYDLVLLATDHDSFDYQKIAEDSSIIIDTRNVFARKGIVSNKIHKA
jgi:UDP-N-acetyl-D-glucosamine dehydrogenase